jgi:hypothetical protein
MEEEKPDKTPKAGTPPAQDLNVQATLLEINGTMWVPLYKLPDHLKEQYDTTHVPGEVYPVWSAEQRDLLAHEALEGVRIEDVMENFEAQHGAPLQMLVKYEFFKKGFLPGLHMLDAALGMHIFTECVPKGTKGLGVLDLRSEAVGCSGAMDLQLQLQYDDAAVPVYMYVEGHRALRMQPATGPDTALWKDYFHLWRQQILVPVSMKTARQRLNVPDIAHIMVVNALTRAATVFNCMQVLHPTDEDAGPCRVTEPSARPTGDDVRAWGFLTVKHFDFWTNEDASLTNELELARDILLFLLRLAYAFQPRVICGAKILIHELYDDSHFKSVARNMHACAIVFVANGLGPRDVDDRAKTNRMFQEFGSASTKTMYFQYSRYVFWKAVTYAQHIVANHVDRFEDHEKCILAPFSTGYDPARDRPVRPDTHRLKIRATASMATSGNQEVDRALHPSAVPATDSDASPAAGSGSGSGSGTHHQMELL